MPLRTVLTSSLQSTHTANTALFLELIYFPMGIWSMLWYVYESYWTL